MFASFVAVHPILAVGCVVAGISSRSFVTFAVAFVGLAWALS